MLWMDGGLVLWAHRVLWKLLLKGRKAWLGQFEHHLLRWLLVEQLQQYVQAPELPEWLGYPGSWRWYLPWCQESRP